MPYKDEEARRAATRERMRKLREKNKGVTPGVSGVVTPKVTPSKNGRHIDPPLVWDEEEYQRTLLSQSVESIDKMIIDELLCLLADIRDSSVANSSRIIEPVLDPQQPWYDPQLHTTGDTVRMAHGKTIEAVTL